MKRRQMLDRMCDVIYREKQDWLIRNWITRNVYLDRLDLTEEELRQEAEVVNLEYPGKSVRWFVWKLINVLRKNVRDYTSKIDASVFETPEPIMNSQLTMREKYIVYLMTNGYDYRDIAGIINSTKSTVHRMVEEIRRKYVQE